MKNNISVFLSYFYQITSQSLVKNFPVDTLKKPVLKLRDPLLYLL